MSHLTEALADNKVFENEHQALIYTVLMREGSLGAEKLHQTTGLHRESIQRSLIRMEKQGTIILTRVGRNKKARAVPLSRLQEILEAGYANFSLLLKPLLEVEAGRQAPKIEVYANNHAYGLLQMKLIKLQPAGEDIRVISTRPKEWVEAMVEAKKLTVFEKIRIEKQNRFLLSCFSELRGQVEHNNREYFAGQPANLKRQYRYVQTESSSPLQVQVWYNCIVISIFASAPSVHIVIEDSRVAKAMNAYFNVLWEIGIK